MILTTQGVKERLYNEEQENERQEHKACVGQGGRVDCTERGMALKRQRREATMSMEGKGGTCRSVLRIFQKTQGGW